MIRILAILAVLGALAGIGAGVNHWDNTRLEAARQEGRNEVQAKWDEHERQAQAARESDQRQQRRFNDVLAGQHAQQLAKLETQLGDAREKLAQLSDRPCLDADAVGVLNATGVSDDHAGRAAAGEPESSASAAQAGSDNGTGLRFASQRDVGQYIAYCRTEYAKVADQLNQILDREDKRHPPDSSTTKER